MNRIIFILITSLSILFIGCSEKLIATNYQYKTECLGIEHDGSQTLKAWGNGRNRLDAVEQAKKNAVKEVIFKGITEGNKSCNIKPIIFEINAEEKYEDYFNAFFADNGAFKNFVSLKDERIADKIIRDKKRTNETVTHGLIIRVLRTELKAKLKQDGIIK